MLPCRPTCRQVLREIEWRLPEPHRTASFRDRTWTISTWHPEIRHLSESKAFNHSQFFGPGAVDGDLNNATFGHVIRSPSGA